MSRGGSGGDTRIEAQLARIELALGGSRSERARIIDELRDHLYSAIEDGQKRGLDHETAASRALARLGSPAEVAASFAGRPKALTLLIAGYSHLAILIGAGLATIGVSGLVAAPLGLWFGPEFISGVAPIEPLALDRCAELARYQPGARDCADAWAGHFFQESVAYRVVPGVLGAALMASHWWLLRRIGLRGAWSSRPARGTTLVALATSLAASGVLVAATLIAARDAGAVAGLLEVGGAPSGVGTGWWISVSAGALAAAAASASLTPMLFPRRSTS